MIATALPDLAPASPAGNIVRLDACESLYEQARQQPFSPAEFALLDFSWSISQGGSKILAAYLLGPSQLGKATGGVLRDGVPFVRFLRPSSQYADGIACGGSWLLTPGEGERAMIGYERALRCEDVDPRMAREWLLYQLASTIRSFRADGIRELEATKYDEYMRRLGLPDLGEAEFERSLAEERPAVSLTPLISGPGSGLEALLERQPGLRDIFEEGPR